MSLIQWAFEKILPEYIFEQGKEDIINRIVHFELAEIGKKGGRGEDRGWLRGCLDESTQPD